MSKYLERIAQNTLFKAGLDAVTKTPLNEKALGPNGEPPEVYRAIQVVTDPVDGLAVPEILADAMASVALARAVFVAGQIKNASPGSVLRESRGPQA